MKRTILATSLATLTLALTLMFGIVSHAATTGTDNQNVSANVTSTLELSVPSDLDFGNLDIGDNESRNQGVLVKSNVSYGIQIKADRTDMTEFTTATSTYGTTTLVEAFEWEEAASGSYADISTSNASVVSAAPATPHAGTITNVKYKQEAKFDDEPLGTGIEYHIIITFTATQGI